MNMEQCIHESTLYIHSIYAEPISVTDIAAKVFLSPSYFSFMFRNVTGYTVKNYLNRYRLYRAALNLRDSDKPLAEIAYVNGFSSQQAFTRSFSQMYGITPAIFRKTRPVLNPFPPENLIWRKPSMELVKCFENVRFMHKDTFYVVGMEVDIHYHSSEGTAPIAGLWETWNSENVADTIPNQVDKGVFYGMTHSETVENRGKYMACVEVENLDNLPVGLIGRKFNASEYAVIDTNLEIIFTGKFWRTFYADWLPKSGYAIHEEHNDLLDAFRKYPAIEVYPKGWEGEQSPMLAYAPVVKKV